MSIVRVRFAPSPTGALHIGGVRTALYNYLFARKHQGVFVLRIEDTDQTRYVPGAEQYMVDALNWCGLTPDEGPHVGGSVGPYRQSERKEIYRTYVDRLLANGKAYVAFDTEDALGAMRERLREAGQSAAAYDHSNRLTMTNSLTLPPDEVRARLAAGEAAVVRLKVEPGQDIRVHDLIRGEVTFRSDELDDKVLLKSDGMPTYHLANIVDDHLMGITHVIRGEEWLPSTAHHVLLYDAFEWRASMPQFAHLPLILRPDGKGKLSKRDGSKFGIPVFPLAWEDSTPEDSFTGFREVGFEPEAVVNFLAFLGWNPGTEQEIFDLETLTHAFDLARIHKGGARFDYQKALWFNQQYLQAIDGNFLAERLLPEVHSRGWHDDPDYLASVCDLMKYRVAFAKDILPEGYYFYEPVRRYDEDTLRKKWKPEITGTFDQLTTLLLTHTPFQSEPLETLVKAWLQEHQISMGAILPLYRLALAGTMKGPGVFEMMQLLGPEKTRSRLKQAVMDFNRITSKA
jgi:glutamyl-tRNA synthetase